MHDFQQIVQVARMGERARPVRFINAGLGSEGVEKQHVPAEPAEAEEVLQEHPGVPAVVGALGERSRNRKGGLRHTMGAAATSPLIPKTSARTSSFAHYLFQLVFRKRTAICSFFNTRSR